MCSAHDRMAKVKAFMHYESIVKVQEQIAAQVKDAEGLVLKKELQQRLRVLRRLGYLNDAGIVLEKGHVRFSCTCMCPTKSGVLRTFFCTG